MQSGLHHRVLISIFGLESVLVKNQATLDSQMTREFDESGVLLSGGELQKLALIPPPVERTGRRPDLSAWKWTCAGGDSGMEKEGQNAKILCE